MSQRIQMTANGLEVSRIIPGLMRLNEWGLDTTGLVSWIESCLDMGLTTFDHADIYGSYTCEAVFGQALYAAPSLREKMELVTKCGIMLESPNRPQNNIHYYDTSYNHIIQSAETSLSNFHTDYLDLLLIHRPDALMEADEVAKALTDLRDAGKIRHAGVSNFTPSQFDLLQSRLDFPLQTNQVEFSVLFLDPLYDGTFDHAQQHRYAPMIWSPMAGGRIFRAEDERSQRTRAEVQAVGEETGGALDQVMLAWMLRHPAQILPVLGTGKLERIQGAIGALDLTMSREQWYRIWTASAGHEVP